MTRKFKVGDINHEAEAIKHIKWAREQQERDGEFDFSVRDNALIAQAEATLALVEQQRIGAERAWDEGYADGYTSAKYADDENPYRKDAS